MLHIVLPVAALLLLPPRAVAQTGINLTLNTNSSANGPQAPGQQFSMSMNYQWSNAPGGQHNLSVSFSVPAPLEIVNASAPLGGSPNGMRSFVRSFTTTAAGPFNQSSNTSGAGSFTLMLRFRAGVTAGTQACIAPVLRDNGPSGPSSQQCFTAGGGSGGPGGPGGPGNPGGGTNTPAVSHWGINHELADGTGVTAPTAIFRVRILNATPTAVGEPGLVAPIITYSVINPAKIVAVSQSPSPSSGLPMGWTVSGALPSAAVSITGPATLAPTATLPVLYVHVSLTGVALGGTNQAVAALVYKLSSNPQSAPMTLGSTKEVRVVTVLK